MSTMKTVGLAIGIALAASSFALAQQGKGNPTNKPAAQQTTPTTNPAASGTQQGNPTNNAAASGGGGTHQTSQKTGSAANSQKVAHNQNGYKGKGRHRRLYSYYRGERCHFIRHPVSRRLVKICH